MKPPARIISAVLIALAAAFTQAGELPQGVMPVAGKPAPPLQLDNLDGESYDLENSQGRWRFVHFWASWCGPCRKEMPSIDRMTRLLEDTDIEFVLVNTAETEDSVFTFLGVVAPDLVPLLDNDGLVTEAWQPRGLPATYLVNPDGLIRYQALGGRDWEQPPYLEFLRGLDR
ncbi:MAG: TlpA disulfide reductase family protein [Gammaproteobacteria bacterium]|jgi:thiol-disulfide isomerase/thioredoxin